jgi:hypothetical protein
MITDLETVDPKGRIDVLVYRGAEQFLKGLEAQHGLSGIWDNAKPIVNQMVNKGISGIEIPAEVKMILGIIQANWKKA